MTDSVNRKMITGLRKTKVKVNGTGVKVSGTGVKVSGTGVKVSGLCEKVKRFNDSAEPCMWKVNSYRSIKNEITQREEKTK